MIPPGALPGMRNLAMAPAIRPNSTHNRMPMIDLPFNVAEFRGSPDAYLGYPETAQVQVFAEAGRPKPVSYIPRWAVAASVTDVMVPSWQAP